MKTEAVPFYSEAIKKAVRCVFPAGRIDIYDRDDAEQETWVRFLETVYSENLSNEIAVIEIFRIVKEVKREAISLQRHNKELKEDLKHYTPEDKALQHRLLDIWDRWVERLPQRENALIRFVQLNTREVDIADRLGISQSAVSQMKHRIIAEFRRYVHVNRNKLLLN